VIALLLLACTGEIVDDTASDTADSAEVEGVDVACGLESIGSESVWGGWLEGVRAPEAGCDGEAAEPCELTGGHRVEAEWYTTQLAEWVDGYDRITNDPDDATRAFVSVQQESSQVTECHITLY
jgi:hypothetical protein